MSAASYNLLDERWVPVLCRSGRRRDIAPHQLSDPDDPPVRIVSPRPDFDGALVQLLIGLVQTCAAPETKREWRQGFDDPPSPESLQARFASVREAFWLDGDGPRFMQDLDLCEPDGKPWSIGTLLIEAPGDNTLKGNKDLFAKRGQVEAMSLPMAAMALLTLQINAPSGGSGHRVGLRGGGPLTTLVLGPPGSTLWQTVWLNVLRSQQFHSGPGDPALLALADTFPWMAPTRTSEGGRSTSPVDVHPAHHFWLS